MLLVKICYLNDVKGAGINQEILSQEALHLNMTDDVCMHVHYVSIYSVTTANIASVSNCSYALIIRDNCLPTNYQLVTSYRVRDNTELRRN